MAIGGNGSDGKVKDDDGDAKVTEVLGAGEEGYFQKRESDSSVALGAIWGLVAPRFEVGRPRGGVGEVGDDGGWEG
jgi:hypothetical protein